MHDLDNDITILSQKHYTEEILLTYDSWDVTPSSTILSPGKRLEMSDTIIVQDKIFHLCYCDIVGSLGYLVNMVRPDLAFTYSELNKYAQYPQPIHTLVWGWVDTDWVGDIETRHSHPDYVLILNGGPISSKSLRQDSVTLSTSESEYMSVSLCDQEVSTEVVYIRAILRDFGVKQTQLTLVYEDNLA
jgi:hypothetical protein